MIDDDEVWDTAHIEDLWIFDKLILAKKLGYQCGPAGGWTPESKNYIIRPCVNAVGMSKGAYIDYIVKNFWILDKLINTNPFFKLPKRIIIITKTFSC